MAPWLDLPYEIVNVSEEEDKLIKKCFLGYTRPFIKCGKKAYIMPGAFKKHAEAIYNFEVRPDDVWVITFPRSGTTWTQELIWLIQNNLDFETAMDQPLFKRFPMLETTSQIPDIGFDMIKMNFMKLGDFQGLGAAARYPSWKSLAEAPSPRFIKTHLPLSLLPPKLISTAKVVYVARDPRDVVVSYYYLHKMIIKNLMRTSLLNYWEAFRKDLLPYTPIISHTDEAWRVKDHPNMHLIYYEDLHKDLELEVRKMCKFLNKDYTTEQIKKLADYLKFDKLKNNKNVNNTHKGTENIEFIRKGKIDSWKEHFDGKMIIQAEQFLTDRLQNSIVKYPSFSLIETTHL